MILIPKIQTIVFNFIILLSLFFNLGCSSSASKANNLSQISAHNLPQQIDETPSLSKEEIKERASKVVEASTKAYEALNDYTTIFHKEERLRKKSKLRPKETLFVKFRKPNQIYMKWVKHPNKDMELIYPVKDNKLLVEPGGLLDIVTPKLYLDLTDKLSMVGNRHPITEFGIGFLVKSYSDDFKLLLKDKGGEIKFDSQVSFFGRNAVRIEIKVSEESKFQYYCQRSVVFFDVETKLPIHVEFYDKEDVLFERYSFTETRLNPGLIENDFDEENPEYDF